MIEPMISRGWDTAVERAPGAGSWIDRIRVNTIAMADRDGRAFVVKTRRPGVRPMLVLANVFFSVARNPARVIVATGSWQKWERDCFRLLHRDSFSAEIEMPASVVVEKVPGTSLALHLAQGTFRETMLDAAGTELRRGHALYSPGFDGLWSHGDANLANFIHDAFADRARLIDFEMKHDRHLSAEARHAEDLLVFLQDLAGCVSGGDWVPLARRFLKAYQRPQITRLLLTRLVVPDGVPWIWWKIRCNYLPGAELRTRFEKLRRSLESVPL